MPGGELHVQLADGAVDGDVPVLLVHVDYISSCSILKYDSVVLNGVSFLLEDLRNGNDLSLAFSNLVLSLHLIPEVGTSNNGVLSKHSDSVASRIRVLLSGSLSTDNPVLSDLKGVKSRSYFEKLD